MAQVTVYGLLDVGYSSVDTEVTGAAASKRTVKSTGANGSQAGSRLGFRGEEDLGGGMKAGFVYEIGLDPTATLILGSNPSTGNNRQSFISLSGGFGEVRLGRQYTGFFGVNAGYDAGGTVSVAGYLPTTNQIGSQYTTDSNYNEWVTNVRQDDVIRYQTPTINGFNASVAVSQNSSETTVPAGSSATAAKTETSGMTVSATYAAGPLSAMVAMSQGEQRTSPTASADLDRMNVGVSYNLGVLSVHVTHNQKEVDDKSTTNGDSDYSDTNVGVKVPLGAATVWASTGEGEYEAKGTLTGRTRAIDLSAYQLGVSYALSKRTNLYAVYGEDEGKNKATGAKNTNTGLALGVRHTF
jgi:predicted porin